MAVEDAYGNKERLERRLRELPTWVKRDRPPSGRRIEDRKRRYYILNPKNVKHARRLLAALEARDLSYVRRNRYLDVFVLMCAHTKKEITQCRQHDVDKIVAAGHKTHQTRQSKRTLLTLMDNILQILGIQGVEISRRVDRAVDRQEEEASFDGVCKIVRHLRNEPMFRAFVTTILETFIRPQELVWRTMKDVRVVRKGGVPQYAEILVSSHGKEGTKPVAIYKTLCYLVDWIDAHPHRRNPDAYLFPDERDFLTRMSVTRATRKVQAIARRLGVEGRLGSYRLKTLGATFALERGDNPKEIQAQAGWASIKQLDAYDKTKAERVLKLALAREGVLDEKLVDPIIRPKDCPCGAVVGFAERGCPSCQRRMTDSMIRQPGRAQGDGVPRVRRSRASAESKTELVSAIAEVLRDERSRAWLQELLGSAAEAR